MWEHIENKAEYDRQKENEESLSNVPFIPFVPRFEKKRILELIKEMYRLIIGSRNRYANKDWRGIE